MNDICHLFCNCDVVRSEYSQVAMKRAVVERLADVKGLVPPYHVSDAYLIHVGEQFEHSRSTVEASCGEKRKTVPSSAGDVFF